MSAGDTSTLPGLVAGRLSTAVVSDILDDLGHRDHVLDPAIRPIIHAHFGEDIAKLSSLLGRDLSHWR